MHGPYFLFSVLLSAQHCGPTPSKPNKAFLRAPPTLFAQPDTTVPILMKKVRPIGQKRPDPFAKAKMSLTVIERCGKEAVLPPDPIPKSMTYATSIFLL